MSRLLIIEDELNIRKFLITNLTLRGFQVEEAETAELGLEMLRREAPRLLILDMRLPGMSGWDLLELMSKDGELVRIPVIVMTASPIKLDDNPYPNVVDLIVKPVSAVDLIHAVRRVLDAH
jgi:CheY-like chemotaxis protein